jgi:hypothetical protein
MFSRLDLIEFTIIMKRRVVEMNKSEKIIFPAIPMSIEEFKALPQAQMMTAFDTAAMTVLALSVYPSNKALSLEMIDFLRGPRPLSVYEKQFIADRFMDVDYVPRSYFVGAIPDNDYTPDTPYTVVVSEEPYSYTEQGYVKLMIRSGGADSPRSIKMRNAKDGKWYLWEQFLLVGIRSPESTNPWA